MPSTMYLTLSLRPEPVEGRMSKGARPICSRFIHKLSGRGLLILPTRNFICDSPPPLEGEVGNAKRCRVGGRRALSLFGHDHVLKRSDRSV